VRWCDVADHPVLGRRAFVHESRDGRAARILVQRLGGPSVLEDYAILLRRFVRGLTLARNAGLTMPNLPYLPADINSPADIVGAVRARRGGSLLNLDRMLLHSPAFAEGWNDLLGSVRTRLSLPPLLRELAICAVGILNGAPYEVQQHAGPFFESGGSLMQLEALRDCAAAAANHGLFTEAQRAVLQLAIAMTLEVRVTPELFSAARRTLNTDQQMVELIGVIATYNMVSRFLVALDINSE
jgi:alkylhydroperoxidase family enzyme